MPSQSEIDEYEEYSSEADDVIAAAVNMIHSDPPGARPDLWREFYRNTVVYVPDGWGDEGASSDDERPSSEDEDEGEDEDGMNDSDRAEAMAFAAMFPRPDEIPIIPSQTRKRARDDSTDGDSSDEEMHTPKKLSSCPVNAARPKSAEPYYLNFGRNEGYTLDEIPPSYIDWILNVGVYDNRPDLASELEERGLLKTTRPDEDDIRAALRTWRLPAPDQAYEPGFYNHITEMAWWIAQSDARLYFDVTENMLRRAGIEPLEEKPLRYPLYLVYSCAEHFETIDPDTVQDALKRFLRKNERRRFKIVGRTFSSCERPRFPHLRLPSYS